VPSRSSVDDGAGWPGEDDDPSTGLDDNVRSATAGAHGVTATSVERERGVRVRRGDDGASHG
jgi:hypothetical protein